VHVCLSLAVCLLRWTMHTTKLLCQGG